MKGNRKTKGLSYLVICTFSLLCMAGCSSTFMVSKGGKGYYLGSGNEIRVILCESGDLDEILRTANLERDVKDDIFQFTCTHPSRERIKELYGALSKEQRRELRLSFQKHGYDVNTAFC